MTKFAASARRATTPRRSPRTTTSTSECFQHNASTSASRTRRRPSTARRRHHDNHTLIHVPHTRSQHHYHNKKLTAQNPFLCVLYLRKPSLLSITVSFACYYNQKTIRRWASTKCTPVYITHQMNAQRARLRPAYYSLATAGGANKIRSSTWVLSDTNRLATVQPHSAVHEQTASLQPHPKGLKYQ